VLDVYFLRLVRVSLRTSKTVQPELIDLRQSVGVLPIILNDIDVVGSGEETSKGRRFRIPQRC